MPPRKPLSVLCLVALLPATADAQSARRRGPTAAQVSAEEREARRHHALGIHALYEADLPETAIAELQAAREIRAGGPLEYLEFVPIAEAYQRLQQYMTAIRWFRRRLEVNATPPRERLRELLADHDMSLAQVEARIQNLTVTRATLSVECNTSVEVWVDNHLAGDGPGEVLIDAGARTVELRAADYIAVQREVTLAGGRRDRLRLTLQRRGIGGIHPAGALSIGSVAAVAVLSGAGFWIGALVEQGAVEGANRGRASVEQLDDARTYALVGDVLVVTGLAFGVVAGILWARTDWSRMTVRRPAPTATLLPQIGGGGAGLQLVGAF